MGHFLLVWWGIFKVSGIFLSFEIRKCIFWLCSREGFISSKYQIFRHSKLFKVISCSRLRANEPQTEVVYQGKNNKAKIQISGLVKNQNNNLKYTTMVYRATYISRQSVLDMFGKNEPHFFWNLSLINLFWWRVRSK